MSSPPVEPTDANRSPKRQGALVLGVQLVLALLTGMNAVLIYAEKAGSVWRLFAALSVCSLISAIPRSGWLIPCTILGVVVGVVADATIKGGTHESQMWETVRSVAVWTVVGIVVGFFCDYSTANAHPGSE